MDALILSAVRTPVGKFLGGLSYLPAPRLGAVAIAEAVARAGVRPTDVNEVIFGHVVQAGVGQAPARQAALLAGLPDTIPAVTVNKVCGSGLKAVMLAAQAIRAGDADVIVAGGMESMSRAPYLLPNARTGFKYGDQKAVDALVHDGLWCAIENWPMGDAAEHTAAQCGVGRADQDRFAAQSHRRAAAAWERGDFAAEVVPVTVGSGAKAQTVTRDEGIRSESTPEGLAKLRPAFKPDGTVTAGNASQLSDGAAAVVVASARAAERLRAKPLARIVAYAASGVAPKDLFIAPVSAVKMVCEKAKLSLADIDLFEINEAFAAQMLACEGQLGLDEAKVNVNGGAIAIGHPIGASGARVLTTLVHALHRRGLRHGLASLCLGGGNAVAMVVERVS
ncbi:thiolase family protein [Fimbriiglobus ruber]|uniref:Acetyl-CoA acetyltransferase n=1 Tax=Fimbriiglobus ruber TaxID=1908690 RepID=A0A225E453_9BACT|nr:acetyl-CoA C-acetyltransferase [Fimbriiglobus ruber]OWK46534.1 acetyl-CoA acetyltransferase [Fimbriiglobus ruber]